MKSHPINKYIYEKQVNLYKELNNYTPIKGRILAPFVAIADTGLDIVHSLAYMITNLALSAINLVGAAFNKECTVKDSLKCLQAAITGIPGTIITILFSPIKVIFQTGAILIDPKRVQPFHKNNTFKQNFYAY